MSEDLYILSPLLKSCKPVDGSDTHYSNQYHASIVNHLKKPLNIELYNEKWLDTPPKICSPPSKHDHATLSFPPTPFPSHSKLHKETNNSLPQLLPKKVNNDECSPLTPTASHKSLLNSDGLFSFDILPRIHLNLVGFWYKSTLTRHTNWTWKSRRLPRYVFITLSF